MVLPSEFGIHEEIPHICSGASSTVFADYVDEETQICRSNASCSFGSEISEHDDRLTIEI